MCANVCLSGYSSFRRLSVSKQIDNSKHFYVCFYIHYHYCFSYMCYCYYLSLFSVLEQPCPHNERVHAYTGMLNILHQNPHLLLNNKTNLYSYLVALLAWQEVPPDSILVGLREVLIVVRTNNTTLFNKVLSKFGLHYDVTALVNMYQLSA